MITGTDFLMIPCENYDEAVAFYGETLGLEKSKRWGTRDAQEFETGNLTIAVVRSADFGMSFSPLKQPIAFQVADAAAARAELESKGVAFTADTIDSGVCHMAIFNDPAGNALMLHQRYAPKD